MRAPTGNTPTRLALSNWKQFNVDKKIRSGQFCQGTVTAVVGGLVG